MRPNLLKLALAILAAVLLAGCASFRPNVSAQASASAQPSSSHPVAFKTFASAALGVAFRYPATWKKLPEQPGDRTGDGVTFAGSRGDVQVGVNYAYADSKSPLLFADARPSDLRILNATLAPTKVLRSQIEPLGGLQVGTLEFLADLPTGAPIVGLVHEVLSASGLGQGRSQIRIVVFCQAGQWAASRATLLSVLASVRFSKPHIAKSGSTPAASFSP